MLAVEAVVGNRLNQMDTSIDRLEDTLRSAIALLLQRRQSPKPEPAAPPPAPTKMVIHLAKYVADFGVAFWNLWCC